MLTYVGPTKKIQLDGDLSSKEIELRGNFPGKWHCQEEPVLAQVDSEMWGECGRGVNPSNSDA